MKHLYLKRLGIATFGLLAIASAAASSPQKTETRLARYVGVTPAPGQTLDILEANDAGMSSILFNFDLGQGALNTSEELYATLEHNGETIAVIPSTNYKRTTYDNFFAFIWCMSFWESPREASFRPGTFTLTIPEGYFIVDGAPSEAFHAEYYINPQSVTCAPPQGKVRELTEVTLTWPEAKEIRVDLSNPDSKPYFLSTDAHAENPEFDFTVEGNQARFTLKEPVTATGLWQVGVPSELITISKDGVEFTRCYDNTDLKYNVEEEFTAVPEMPLADPIRFIPGTMKCKMPEGHALSIVNNLLSNTLHHVDAAGERSVPVARYLASKADGDRTLALTNKLGKDYALYLADGRYKLVLTERVFAPYPGNNFSPELAYDFEVVNLTAPFSASPVDGSEVRSIESIEMTFPEAVKIGTAQPVSISDGVASYLAGIRMKEGDDKSVVITPMRPITRQGSYVVTADPGTVQSAVPGRSGRVNCYDVYSRLKVTDNPGAVKDTFASDETITVYTLDGILMLENEPAEALRRLEPGFYVVNGRKVLLRR